MKKQYKPIWPILVLGGVCLFCGLIFGLILKDELPKYEIVERIDVGDYYSQAACEEYEECYCEEIERTESYCGDTEITPEKSWGLMTSEEQDSICAHYYYEGFRFYKKYSTHITQHICYIKEKIRTN